MQKEKNNRKSNFYKLIFHKHDSLPVGHFSRNLINKIKGKSNDLNSLGEKNVDYFNPISEFNAIRIQKIYSKFQRNKSAKKYSTNISNRKINKFVSRPLSQYSTIIDLSKYKNFNQINLKNNNNSQLPPLLSEIKSYSTFLVDKHNISNENNLSKIEKLNKAKSKSTIYKNKIYVPKNKQQRSA